ncbi:thiamine pyrophosphate-binding protein [Nocardiopsis dassonvillei]|uniref:thiamine pyrophosphate-binding protein n=1 Tax=Nocardiopsis dassonvillei TaxID=2014 RepID=UPI0033CEDBFE
MNVSLNHFLQRLNMRLNSYLHQKLKRMNVELAFGVPGSFVMPIWQTFKKEPRIILARHESGAVFMADGWSRATGRLGVAIATIGPGLTNCVTGVACAYRDSIPMLVVTGQAPTASFGRGAFLESFDLDRSVSPRALFAPITKRSLEVVDLANARFLIDTAISLALDGRPGPVHLSIPVDLQSAELPDVPSNFLMPDADLTAQIRPFKTSEDLEVIAVRLAEAQRPLVLAGWGAAQNHLGSEIADIANHLGAPVITTTKALSCVPGTNPQMIGHLGPGQRSDLVSMLGEYKPDHILILGASLSQYYAQSVDDMLSQAFTTRIDIDPDQLRLRHEPDFAIIGDLRTILPRLRQEVLALPVQPTQWAERLAAFRDRRSRARGAQASTFRGHISMSHTIIQVGQMLPPDAIVVPDAGNHWLDTISLHEPGAADGLLLNCGLGAMGWAIGASVGLALANLGRRIVCITGDGSALMHGAELSVAAEQGADLLVIIFNNRSHGRVRLGQKMEFDGDPLGTDLPSVDFSQWMSAMGLITHTVDKPEQLAPALIQAASGGTVGIEVYCHPDEVPAALRNWIEDAS